MENKKKLKEVKLIELCRNIKRVKGIEVFDFIIRRDQDIEALLRKEYGHIYDDWSDFYVEDLSYTEAFCLFCVHNNKEIAKSPIFNSFFAAAKGIGMYGGEFEDESFRYLEQIINAE